MHQSEDGDMENRLANLGGPDKFAIILGCAKSGTTSLYEYLVRHPEICECSTREPNSSTYYLKEGKERYKNLWDWDPSVHEYAMEKSNQYTYPTGVAPPSGPEVPSFVSDLKEIKAEFHFLYIVRDPIERAKSHLKHYIVQGYDVQYRRPADIPWLVGTSQYAKRLEPFAKTFGRENIFVLTFEDLVGKPKKTVDQVCDFLGLPSAPDPPNKNYNPTDGVWNTSLWNKLRDISLLREGFRKIPIKFRSKVRRFFNSSIEEEVGFDRPQREKFVDIIREDVGIMRDKYDVDISGWSVEV